MKFLGVFLTILVLVRHDTAYALGEVLSLSPRAAYYVLGGIQETVLWTLVATFILSYRNSIWRSLALGACVIGIVEGLMIPICRVALKGRNTGDVCDFVTGLPIGGTMVAVYTLVICWYLARWKLTQN